jgi:sec-independent protein translocase protein TatA
MEKNMGLSFAHLFVLMIVVFTLFGAGKLPKVMGDIGKGIKNLRDEIQSDNDPASVKQVANIDQHKK